MITATVTPFRYPTPLQRTIAQRWVDAAEARLEQAKAGGNPDAIRCAQESLDELIASLANASCEAVHRADGQTRVCRLRAGHPGLHDCGYVFSDEIEAGRKVQ